MRKIYVGIDLGKKGGIAVIHHGKLVHQEIMPLIADTDVDVNHIRALIVELQKKGPVHIVIERFAGFHGYAKSAVASLARQSGMIETLLLIEAVPHTTVMPQQWQKVMFENTKDLRKSDGTRDTKKMALLVANRLLPKEKFRPSTRYKNAHDGLVDAALLALYAERKGF